MKRGLDTDNNQLDKMAAPKPENVYEQLKLAIDDKEPNLTNIRQLIENHNINLNTPSFIVDTGGRLSILHYVALKGHVSILNLLMADLGIKDIPTIDGRSILYFVAKGGNIKCLQYLLEKGANPNGSITYGRQKGDTELYIATLNGDLDVVKVLINIGANPNASINASITDEITPLYIASANGNLDIVQVLINGGANPNYAIIDGQSKGFTPLHIAAKNMTLDIVKLLINSGANPNAHVTHDGIFKGFTPLHLASANGDVEAVKVLINSGANPNPYFTDKITPLYIAAANGHIEVVKTLVIAGAKLPNLLPPRIKDGLKKTFNIAYDLAKICSFTKISKADLKGEYETHEDIKFAIQIFMTACTRGDINFINYNELIDKLNGYNDIVPTNLLEILKKETKSTVSAMEFVSIIEGQLFEYFEGISPLPISVYEERDNSIQPTTESGRAEHNKYQEFMQKPENAKYKKPGEKLKEFIKDKNDMGLSLMAELMLKGSMVTEGEFNPLEAIKKQYIGSERFPFTYRNEVTAKPGNSAIQFI